MNHRVRTKCDAIQWQLKFMFTNTLSCGVWCHVHQKSPGHIAKLEVSCGRHHVVTFFKADAVSSPSFTTCVASLEVSWLCLRHCVVAFFCNMCCLFLQKSPGCISKSEVSHGRRCVVTFFAADFVSSPPLRLTSCCHLL